MKIDIKQKHYNNGVLSCETLYHQGQKHGVRKKWDTGGKIICEIPYNHGQKHGVGKWWWYNGQPWKEISYHQGQLHGIERWWRFGDGKLSVEKYHLYDKKVTQKEYETGQNTNKTEVKPPNTCTCNIATLMNNGCISNSGGTCPSSI